MNDRLLSLVGLARRAGRLSLGFDAAAEAMNKGRTKLLIIACDLSGNSTASIIRTAERTHTKTIVINRTKAQIGAAVGKEAGIIAVNDEGFAEKMAAYDEAEKSGGIV